MAANLTDKNVAVVGKHSLCSETAQSRILVCICLHFSKLSILYLQVLAEALD
jgi:hypothetical protein